MIFFLKKKNREVFFFCFILKYSMLKNCICVYTDSILANLRIDAFISLLLSTHQHHHDYDHHHKCKKNEREDSPFGWFDWIELALTWQVSEQDETYIEKNERVRQRERKNKKSQRDLSTSIKPRCHILELALNRQANEAQFDSPPIIYSRRGGNGLYTIWHLSFCLTYTKKFNLLWSILFFFSFFYAWHYCPIGVNWAIERWHFNVCRHVVSDLLPLNRNDGS